MADRFATQISIGGKVKRTLVPALIEAINAEQLQRDWGSDLPEIQNEEELLSHKNEKGVLWFCYDERAWGRFEDLEEFLRKRRIPYDRRHEPRYEYDGELALFRPEKKGVRYCAVDASGALIVPVEGIQRVRDLLKRKPSKTSIKQALRDLNSLCEDADVEPLPAFEIVERNKIKRKEPKKWSSQTGKPPTS